MKSNHFNVRDSILYENGYYKLDNVMRAKWDMYISAPSGEKYCSFFSWDEFCYIFAETTFIYYFVFDNCEYSIGKENGLFSLVGESQGLIQTYKSPQDLLSNAKINGQNLCQIYNNLLLN